MTLIGQSGVLDDGDRRMGGQASVLQRLGDLCRGGHPHVDHQRELCRMDCGCQLLPVHASAAWFGMTGDKQHAVGTVAVGQGCPQAGDTSESGCNSVDDLYIHTQGAQVLGLFPASSKNKRVSSFEAHHMLTFLHGQQHELFNEGLGGALATTPFAYMHDACAGRRMGDDFRGHQVINQQQCGALDGL